MALAEVMVLFLWICLVACVWAAAFAARNWRRRRSRWQVREIGYGHRPPHSSGIS